MGSSFTAATASGFPKSGMKKKMIIDLVVRMDGGEGKRLLDAASATGVEWS